MRGLPPCRGPRASKQSGARPRCYTWICRSPEFGHVEHRERDFPCTLREGAQDLAYAPSISLTTQSFRLTPLPKLVGDPAVTRRPTMEVFSHHRFSPAPAASTSTHLRLQERTPSPPDFNHLCLGNGGKVFKLLECLKLTVDLTLYGLHTSGTWHAEKIC
jgi:hypothetical protein